MNDLDGLSWDSAPAKLGTSNRVVIGSPAAQAPAQPASASAPSLRPSAPVSSSVNISRQPSPLSSSNSGRNTPQHSFVNNTSRGAGVADSFSSLLGPSASTRKTNPNSLTLSERQRQLVEEKERQAAQQREKDNALWESLEKGRAPTPSSNIQVTKNASLINDDYDILSAFNASAPVDTSSHFPPPKSQTTSNSASRLSSPANVSVPPTEDEDEDLFGLKSLSKPVSVPSAPRPPPSASFDADDDDILGDLGKPVSEAIRKQATPSPRLEESRSPPLPLSSNEHPQDKAVAELVDMGFSADRAREALGHTETGMEIQDAVAWLLNQAHQESRSKSRSTMDPLDVDRRGNFRHATNGQREDASGTGASMEKDVGKYASELGSTFLKSANSLWKSGQKKVQKAMADFQHEGDNSQPRWMQNGQTPSQSNRRQPGDPSIRGNSQNITNEAALLESQRSRPAPRQPPKRTELVDEFPKQTFRRNDQSPQDDSRSPAEMQRPVHQASRPASRPASRLTREAVESQNAEAYVSPARRRKVAPVPKPPVSEEPTLDIFLSSQATPISTAQTGPASEFRPSRPQKSATSIPVRPAVSNRQIPPVSASATTTSATHRQKGTDSFKRGDYAEAHSSYTAALSPIPSGHPMSIVLHCNRALTAIKTGDPKAAIADADAALSAIGPSNGEGETISLGDGEAEKPMKEFFGKALMRKAEALENMEKWSDAAKVYRQAVEAGAGGAPAIQGRSRCEKAAGVISSSGSGVGARATSAPPGGSTTKPPPARKPAKALQRSALNDLNGNSGMDSEAVKRLRAANAAAAAASDEAFVLNDAVEARLAAWKTGKEGNLRALLASLDTVLWAGAGWNKVGMSDLVLPPRVKIIYMKAIGKCHPDKISTNATTEQRMVSASVFATLNEAWDKFKTDNGL